MKRTINCYCPECKKNRKCENFPEGLNGLDWAGRLIFALIFLFICPIISIIVVIVACKEKKHTNVFYCCECGAKVDAANRNQRR